jgi:hypothetical protein
MSKILKVFALTYFLTLVLSINMNCIPHVDSIISDAVKFGAVTGQSYRFLRICRSKELQA